MKFLPTCK